LPQLPPAPRIPTADETSKAVTQVIDDTGKVVGKFATDASKEAGIGLSNVANESGIAFGNIATTIRKAGSDTGAQLNRSQHDLEDAGTAIYRFSLHQIEGTKDTLSHAEKRLREGKVVDALFHLGTEPFQNADNNAAQAAQESSLLSTVGSVSASVYGGPGGAAAYAAWLTYHQTGDINMAIRVGVIAGASAYANSQAATMQTGTLTDSIKRAAVVGAIGGAAVAASGGDPNAINQAFLKGGAAILVQDGYKAYTQRDFTQELGPANGAAMCMAAPVSDAANGCPHPEDYMKDDQGRLIMTDKDGGFHHVEIGTAEDIPKDWRPIGNASATPSGTPVVGIQTDQLPPLSQANEGSATMIALAKVPGMNAMAIFHDRWAVAWEMDPAVTKTSIVPAIVLTYLGATAVIDNASTTGITDAATKAATRQPSTSGASNSDTSPQQPPSTPADPVAPPNMSPESTATGVEHVPLQQGPQPPTIKDVKPDRAPLETLICTRGDSLRLASVIPGKEPGDLQCMLYIETDGKPIAPYIASNIPSFCAIKLLEMGKSMTEQGWACKGR